MAFMIDYGDDWRVGYVDVCNRVLMNGDVRTSRAGYALRYVTTCSRSIRQRMTFHSLSIAR